jgi:hypothetical protein
MLAVVFTALALVAAPSRSPSPSERAGQTPPAPRRDLIAPLERLDSYKLTGIVATKVGLVATFQRRKTYSTVVLVAGAKFRDAEITKITGDAVDVALRRGPGAKDKVKERRTVRLRVRDE